jgi:H+/Cl- antiporter ClcA
VTTPRTNPSNRRVLVRLFDIRIIVGALLAIYGVLLTIAGFFPALLREHGAKATTNDKVDLYVGTAANWWVGLVMLAVAVLFFAWAFLRPHEIDDVGTLKRDA